MASMAGIVGEAGVSPEKVAVDLESEEGPGRGSGCEEPRGPRRPGVFRDEQAVVVASPAASGKDGRPRKFGIFFKLSSSGLELGAGREAEEAAVPAAGRVRVEAGEVAGGFSVTVLEAISVLSSKTFLSHCNDAFFSKSRSSAVIE